MKLMEKLVVFAAALLMLKANVYAEETTYSSLNAAIKGQNISVKETELMGNADNSNLQVEVIEQAGEQTTVIYTGSLIGYDNGAWVNFDFSSTDFLLIFDWDNCENESICIKPTVSQAETEGVFEEQFLDAESLSSENETINSNALENFDNKLFADIKLTYNNEYYEGVLKQNNPLNISLAITNSGQEKELVCYLAEYDSAGGLLELTEDNTITVPAEGNVTVNTLKTFTNPNTVSAKVFLWEEGIIKPVTSSILLRTQAVDYYADTISKAQNYDISKKINGKINTASDIDYIKFVPAENGKYVIQANSTANVSGGLYDAQNNLIISGTSFNGGYYCGTELVSGNTYYLKTTGSTTGEYDITVSKMMDDGLIEITNDSIKLTQSGDSTSQTYVNLYSYGNFVQSIAAAPSNNKISAEFNIDDLQQAYTITVVENNTINAIYDIKTVMSSNIYDVTSKSYVSVPMTVSDVSDLSDIYFSVAFDENEFTIFDACEHTYTTSETGTGFISSAEVNIKAIENNAVVFTSAKSLNGAWSGNVNTVKLQALDAGKHAVKMIAYSVK